MTTALDILVQGLSKISVSSVSSIDPPRTALEKTCAANYPRWRDKQLAKRKWACALEEADLTLTATFEGTPYPYQFLIPNDCVRPLRDRIDGSRCLWQRRGKYLYSTSETLRLPYIKRISENDMDVSLIDVIACWVAVEMAETSTESNAKKSTALQMYKDALAEAAQLNAFVIGEESLNNDEDDGFDYITSRY